MGKATQTERELQAGLARAYLEKLGMTVSITEIGEDYTFIAAADGDECVALTVRTNDRDSGLLVPPLSAWFTSVTGLEPDRIDALQIVRTFGQPNRATVFHLKGRTRQPC